jgi:hypothetical protein
MSGSIPTLAPGLQIAVIGSQTAMVEADFGFTHTPLEDADAALFIVSALTGPSESDAQQWSKARELYIPSLVLITDFESGEIDFDDMAAIVGRILDPVVTPYLVLHSDSGAPVALIELESLRLFDYSNGKREIKESEVEHKELVSEFKIEFTEKVEEFGPAGFQDALLFPALPYISNLGLGKVETLEYLAQLPTRS